jgi:cytoskeletal protein RodZ
MESDDFDFLAPAYVRGFLRSYATFLGLDPYPLLAEFDRSHGVSRVETQQLMQLETRGRGGGSVRVPGRMNNWMVAAVVALLAIIALSAVGIATGNKPTSGSQNGKGGNPNVAVNPGGSPSGTASPSTTPSASTTPAKRIVAEAGYKVTVDAVNGDCWILIVADGRTAMQDTLITGESRTFTADHKMYIKLGNAGAVTMTVNGKRIGPVGGLGQVVDLTLPDDLKSFL